MSLSNENYKYKLEKCLSKIKIDEDIVLIHSSLINFVIRNEYQLKDFCDDLIKYIGVNKTIIMPAFTPSFAKKKYWHYIHSKSETGILTEYFRNNFSEFRSIHPIHSVAIYNNKYDLKHESNSSFGKKSIWEWICNNDVCNLSIGIGLDGGGTICHYAEEYVNIYYRDYCNLEGDVFDKNNKKVKNFFTYFARKIIDSNEVVNNWERCEKDLIKNNIMEKKIFFKNIPICKMNSKKATVFIINKLDSNKNYFL